MENKKTNKLRSFLNKDVKEFNKVILSLVCIGILVTAGLISYYFTNKSYAFFTDSISGTKTMELGIGYTASQTGYENENTECQTVQCSIDELAEIFKGGEK